MEAVDKISVGVSKEKAGQNTQEAITENESISGRENLLWSR
jgi:hypothetical protein